MTGSEKTRALETTLATIQKRYGEGSIMRLGQASHMQVESIPTGSLALDIALGVGGIPRGRVTEIYGPEGSGKTTLCQHIVSEAQRMGGVAAYIDMEHALDPVYAEKLRLLAEHAHVQEGTLARSLLSSAIDEAVLDGQAMTQLLDSIDGAWEAAQIGSQQGREGKTIELEELGSWLESN